MNDNTDTPIERINRLLQQAKSTQTKARGRSREQQLRQAINLYKEALQIADDELGPMERENVQNDIKNAHEHLAQLYDKLIVKKAKEKGLAVTGGHGMSKQEHMGGTRVRLYIAAGLVLLAVLVAATLVMNSSLVIAAIGCVDEPIAIDGSTALSPLVSEVAHDYNQRCHGEKVNVRSPGKGSIAGLSEVEQGRIQIGDTDVFAQPGQDDLVDHQVAAVIFVLVVNAHVTGITNLRTQEIQGIYTGGITNWGQVSKGLNLKIVPLSRTQNSGTRYTLEHYILNGVTTVARIGPATESEVAQEVANTPGAIGYTSLDQARSATGITIVSIDGKDPVTANVQNNSYKFWNIEHMYTKGEPQGLSRAFLAYMYSNAPSHINQPGQNGSQKFSGYLTLQQITQAMRTSRGSS
jgi:phosphate transport system substrate-binding protein